MSAFSNLLIPAVLFFALGFIARLIKSDLRFPPDLAKILSIYLLVSIGLHGGVELANADLGEALAAVVWALLLGLLLPIIGFATLARNAACRPTRCRRDRRALRLGQRRHLPDRDRLPRQPRDRVRALSLDHARDHGVTGHRRRPLARELEPRARRQGRTRPRRPSRRAADNGHLGDILREAFTNGSVVLLIGSMLIGAIANPKAMESLHPFTTDIFMGMLCLFLLEMGLEAGRRFADFRRVGLALGAFGLVMPLIGGVIGVLVGHLMLGFGVGGTTLVGVLGASASYIAVPPAMRLAVPEANPSFYLTLSLGVTFPFNVVFGIPIYHQLSLLVAGGA